MSSPSYPVTVAVRSANGSIEHVRVGTAERVGDGFRLTLGELAIGAVADSAPARRAAPPPSDGGLVFPPYGRSKGAPIAGATLQDLEYYANGCRRTLNDPNKARWHEKERVLLAAIEAEIARQGGEGEGSGGFGRVQAPGRQSGFDDGAGSLSSRDYDAVPPPGDDDIPF